MRKANLILILLLIASVTVNLLLWNENSHFSKLLGQSATRPDALEGQFFIQSEFSAVDASTGDPIPGLKWVGASGAGERSVSAVLNQEGHLIIFGHSSTPIDIKVGADGFEAQSIQLTRLSPKLIPLKLKKSLKEH